jgi:N-acyl homoserine lactone hydrolase
MTGHVSAALRDDSVTYFFAGDATYSEENLRAERTDGVTNDPQTALATLRAIKEFAAGERTIILPAHDPGVPTRLAAL